MAAPVVRADHSVTDHLLVVRNTASAWDEVSTYYLANRPNIAGANVLDLNDAALDASEIIADADYKTKIRDPILAWLAANPTKPIRKILLCGALPTRINDLTYYGAGDRLDSVPWRLSRCLREAYYDATYTPLVSAPSIYNDLGWSVAYLRSWSPFDRLGWPHTTAMVSVLWMGSVAATNAFTDKLAAKSVGAELVISARAHTAAYADNTWYAEDTGNTAEMDDSNLALPGPGYMISQALLAAGVAANKVVYRNLAAEHITAAANPAGLTTWGANGGLGANYQTDGSIVLSGRADWWVGRSIESFNGQRVSSQGSFVGAFLDTAWGGAAYSNTPFCYVAHTDEPGFGWNTNYGQHIYINDHSFEQRLALGWLADEAHWATAHGRQAIFFGDPYTRL